MDFFYNFLYIYPVLMGVAWITGAILYFIKHEWKNLALSSPPSLKNHPPVSILVPCFNEEKTIEETIEALAQQEYPNFDVIAINDGSTDGTKKELNRLEKRIPWIRVIH
ncbi:MAG: glycosyltransferase, partial [Nitrospinota bacterium]